MFSDLTMHYIKNNLTANIWYEVIVSQIQRLCSIAEMRMFICLTIVLFHFIHGCDWRPWRFIIGIALWFFSDHPGKFYVLPSKQAAQPDNKEERAYGALDEDGLKLFCGHSSVPCTLQDKQSQDLTVRRKRMDHTMRQNWFSKTNIMEKFYFYV